MHSRWAKQLSKLLISIPIGLNFSQPEKNLNKILDSLKLTNPENYFAFQKFQEKLSSQNFLNEKFMEDNNNSNLLEMSLILNKLDDKNKKYENLNEYVDSPLFRLKSPDCAVHYEQNIYKEILYDSEKNSYRHKSKEDSKKYSDFDNFTQLSNFYSCHSCKNLLNESCKNKSCISQIYGNTDKIYKLQNLYKKKLVKDFFLNELKNDKNLLCWIRKQFLRVFLKDYVSNRSKILNSIKDQDDQFLNKFLNELIQDLLSFLKIYNETINIYYDLNRIDFPPFLSNDSLLEILIYVIFEDNSNLFNFLFIFQKKTNKSIENQIDFNKKKCMNWDPSEFGISEKYSLNQRTLDYFSRKVFRDNLSFGQQIEDSLHRNSQEIVYLPLLEGYPDPNIKDDINESIFMCEDENDKEFSKVFKNSYANIIKHTMSLSKSTAQKKNFDTKLLTEPPYEKAIEILQEIANLKNPVQIMRIIIETAVEIITSIRHFYEKMGEFFLGNIESDEMMSIFIYICVKSDVKLLYSKCCLIQNFITYKKVSSIYGYYLTTMIASLSCLSDQNFYLRNRKNNDKHFINSLRKLSSKYEHNSG